VVENAFVKEEVYQCGGRDSPLRRRLLGM